MRKEQLDQSAARVRLAEVEAAMREPGIDPRRAQELLEIRDRLIKELRGR